MTPEVWVAVRRLVAWLNAHRRDAANVDLLLRLMKVSEEAGEVAQAVIGARGQNPRKGVTHSWDDVSTELCDVVFAALVALVSLRPDDADEVFARHLARVLDRALDGVR